MTTTSHPFRSFVTFLTRKGRAAHALMLSYQTATAIRTTTTSNAVRRAKSKQTKIASHRIHTYTRENMIDTASICVMHRESPRICSDTNSSLTSCLSTKAGRGATARESTKHRFGIFFIRVKTKRQPLSRNDIAVPNVWHIEQMAVVAS